MIAHLHHANQNSHDVVCAGQEALHAIIPLHPLHVPIGSRILKRQVQQRACRGGRASGVGNSSRQLSEAACQSCVTSPLH